MKRSVKIAVSLLMILVLVSVSAYAAGVIRDVKGKENPNISVTYNGVKQTLRDGNGNVVYPVIINGSTYLPVRAIATTMGAQISWDGATQTVNIVGSGNDDGAVPTDLPPTNPTPSTPPTQPTSTGTSTNAGTKEDPVELGKSFTWLDESNSTSYGFKSNVTMSITSVKPITTAQITALGYRVEEDPRIEYVRVSVNLIGRNVTPTTLSDDYIFISITQPDLWGSEADNGQYIIGGETFGFDGSIGRNIDKRYPYGSNQIKKGSSKSEVNYSGDILLPTVKGQTNYLIMEKANSDIDYDARRIYFKLN